MKLERAIFAFFLFSYFQSSSLNRRLLSVGSPFFLFSILSLGLKIGSPAGGPQRDYRLLYLAILRGNISTSIRRKHRDEVSPSVLMESNQGYALVKGIHRLYWLR
jgi:hypothetical protein